MLTEEIAKDSHSLQAMDPLNAVAIARLQERLKLHQSLSDKERVMNLFFPARK
jgi:hypothetical protein